MKNKLVLKISFIFFAFFASLVLLEIFVRVVDVFNPIVNTKFWVWHPQYGIKYIPNKVGAYVRPEYETRFEINSRGWRDSEHQTEKEPDVLRILVLGDSFVESFQVPLAKTFFKVLERNLEGKIPGKKVEVVAMGIGGSSPTQQYLALVNEGLKYKPDIVIQTFYTQNDIVGNSKVLDYSPFRPYFVREDGGLKLLPAEKARSDDSGVKSSVRENSFLWRFVSDKLNLIREGKLKKSYVQTGAGFPSDYQVYNAGYSKDWQEAWDLTKEIEKDIKEAVESSGAEFVLVSLANIEQVEPGYWDEVVLRYPKIREQYMDLEKPEMLLSEFAEEEKISYLALLPRFKERKQEDIAPLFYFQDTHFNEAGYRLAGESIAEYLTASDLF